MATTPDDNKRLVRRLTGHRRLLFIGLVAMFLLSAGVVAADIDVGTAWTQKWEHGDTNDNSLVGGITDDGAGYSAVDVQNFWARIYNNSDGSQIAPSTQQSDGYASWGKVDVNADADLWAFVELDDTQTELFVGDANGREYKVATGKVTDSAVAITPDRRVFWYRGDTDDIHEYDDAGNLLGTFTPETAYDMDANSDYVFVANSSRNEIIAYDNNDYGKEWTTSTGGDLKGEFEVRYGHIYAAATGGQVYRLSATTGAVQWTVTANSSTTVNDVTASDEGTVFAGLNNGEIALINEDTEEITENITGFGSVKTVSADSAAFDNVGLLVGHDTSGTKFTMYETGLQDTYSISGTVTDQNNNPIESATVTVENSTDTFTDTTSGSGLYSVDGLANDTYNVNVSKDGYTDGNKTVTISGGSKTVDFNLTELNETLQLDVKRFLEHGDQSPYEVTNVNETTDERTDVTGQATVTSNDTTLLTVESDSNNVVATTDESLEGLVEVTAEYDGKVATETVFVGNITLENFDKLPPWGRADAILGSQIDADNLNGENASFLLIIVGAMAGAALRVGGSTYLGLAGFELIIIAGWIMGKTGNGLLLISLAAVGFVALNLAANIDYGIR